MKVKDIRIDNLCSRSLFYFHQRHLSLIKNFHPTPQLHGLRQGDRLSPLLFSLAIEPLLRTILTNNQLRGVSLHSVPVSRNNKPWPYLFPWIHLRLRTIDPSLSNVKVMLMIWGCFSLTRLKGHTSSIFSRSMIVRSAQRSTLIKMSSCLSLSLEEAILNEFLLPNAALGYPLYSSQHQLGAYLATVKTKTIRHVHLLKDRLLSTQGTDLVTNSLLLCQL